MRGAIYPTAVSTAKAFSARALLVVVLAGFAKTFHTKPGLEVSGVTLRSGVKVG